jgi:hypothetical protein
MHNNVKNSFALRSLPVIVFILLFITPGCLQEEKTPSPVIGVWELISWEASTNNDSLMYTYPGNVEVFDELFVYTEGYFMFSGRIKLGTDTVFQDNYGGGTYTYDGEHYVEHILYFPAASTIGESLEFDLKISGDTLIKTGPMDAGDKFWGKLREVYVRKE